MNHEHTCECGPRTGPMTRAQHDRIHHGMTLVDCWLASAASGDYDRMQRSLTAVHEYLLDAPTYHANVRQSGLVTYVARRCAAALPAKFDDFAAWLSAGGDIESSTSPEHRIGIRLMVAYQRRDEVHARNLLLDYVNDLPIGDITARLHAVFLCLSEIYVWIDHHQPRPQRSSDGKYDLHVLATRAAAAWNRVSTAFARQ